ncbi:MAG: hypothetical protein ACE5G9_05660 [Nitrospinales bacterium]
MNDENHWRDDPDSGVTPGPEEALRREIEKSKALKVERLALRNEIETLKSENRRLREENRRLRETSADSRNTGIAGSVPRQLPRSTGLFSFLSDWRARLLFLIFVISMIFYYTFSR